MNAEKPGFIEVSIGNAQVSELPVVTGIYWQNDRRCSNVNPSNTFVARNQARAVIGAATVSEPQPSWVKIEVICVDPALHGRGIGSQLLGAVVDEMRRQGKRAVVVDLPQENRQSFYSQFGFEMLDSQSMIKHL